MTYYTQDHEWVRHEGDVAVVGITQHAAEALGDLVFIDLHADGKQVSAGDAVAVVESVKAASDIYAPVGGQVVEVNSALSDDPTVVSADPEGAGWLVKIRLDDPASLSELLDRAAYDALVAGA